jgi:hypothetical protein
LTVTDIDGNIDTDTVVIRVGAAGGGGGSSGGICFIATAAYGSPDAGDVVMLRAFRDKYLITNAPGRAFVNLYYTLSPPIASFISTRPLLRSGVRAGLSPIVISARVALATTPAEKILIALFFSFGLLGTLAVVSKKRRRA